MPGSKRGIPAVALALLLSQTSAAAVQAAATKPTAPTSVTPASVTQTQLPSTALHADDPTIGVALKRLGFDFAATIEGRPDLNRPLTNSISIVSGASYVAAYYFDDETMHGQFGPLHVSRFDGASRRWQHGVDLGSDVTGTIRRLTVQGRYILVELESNPSAGGGLILEERSLMKVHFLQGRGFHPMSSGLIRFSGNMDHLKAVRQETLRVFDPSRGAEAEVFPGERLSVAATNFRNARPVAFNRVLVEIAEADNGRRLTFQARYAYVDVPSITGLVTAVVCVQQAAATAWACTERAID
jgi:hypothetical protein